MWGVNIPSVSWIGSSFSDGDVVIATQSRKLRHLPPPPSLRLGSRPPQRRSANLGCIEDHTAVQFQLARNVQVFAPGPVTRFDRTAIDRQVSGERRATLMAGGHTHIQTYLRSSYIVAPAPAWTSAGTFAVGSRV